MPHSYASVRQFKYIHIHKQRCSTNSCKNSARSLHTLITQRPSNHPSHVLFCFVFSFVAKGSKTGSHFAFSMSSQFPSIWNISSAFLGFYDHKILAQSKYFVEYLQYVFIEYSSLLDSGCALQVKLSQMITAFHPIS